MQSQWTTSDGPHNGSGFAHTTSDAIRQCPERRIRSMPQPLRWRVCCHGVHFLEEQHRNRTRSIERPELRRHSTRPATRSCSSVHDQLMLECCLPRPVPDPVRIAHAINGLQRWQNRSQVGPHQPVAGLQVGGVALARARARSRYVSDSEAGNSYLPLNAGGRFSMNDCTPSRKSLDLNRFNTDSSTWCEWLSKSCVNPCRNSRFIS